MGYEFEGFVAKRATWQAWKDELPSLKVAHLPFELGLSPGSRIEGLGADARACGLRVAEKGLVAYIEASEFGDMSGSSALLFENGVVVDVPVDEALRRLGVTAASGKDEFDTLGLGRNTHRWLETLRNQDVADVPDSSLPKQPPSATAAPTAVEAAPSEEDWLNTMYERGEISSERYQERLQLLRAPPASGVVSFFRRLFGGTSR